VLHINPAPSDEHQPLSRRLAVILDPPADAAGLEAVVGDVNIGDPGDYRITDGSLHRPGSSGTYLSGAELGLRSSPRMTTPGRSSPSMPLIS
jgi:hypothetical protein